MQTERVTFLTTPDHKAALDAFAANQGMSVGHVVREATNRYLAEPADDGGAEEALMKLVMDELERALPVWNAKFDSMEASLDAAHEAVQRALAEVERTKR